MKRCANCLQEVKNPEEKICLRDAKGRFTKEKKALWWARKKHAGSQYPTKIFCWDCMLEQDKKLVQEYGNKERFFVPLENSLKRDEVMDEEYLLRAKLYQEKVSEESHRTCHICGHTHGQIIQEEGRKPYVALVGAVTSDSANTLFNLINEITRDKELRYTCRDCVGKTQDKFNFPADAVDDILEDKRMLHNIKVIILTEKKKKEGESFNGALQSGLQKIVDAQQEEVKESRKKKPAQKKPDLQLLKKTG